MKSVRTTVAFIVIVCAAVNARAQGFSIRAGVSADPDQFYGGVGYETVELLEHHS